MTETRYGGRGQEQCAACRHGRKSCEPDCVFRENFPAERKTEFELVQKIFGVLTLKRMISSASTQEERDQVAKSIEWEAKAWADDPIHGPYGQFKRLEQRLEEQRELSNTHRHRTPKVEVPENNWQDERPQAAECDATPAIENGNTSPVMGLIISTPSQPSPETGDEFMPNYFLHTIGGPDSQIGPLETSSSRGWAQQYRDESMSFIKDYERLWRWSQASFHTSPTIGSALNINNTGNQNGTDIHQLNSMNTHPANTTSPGQSRDNHHARFP